MQVSRLCTSLFLALACLGPARAAVVESLHSYPSDDYTRMVFELDDTLEHRVFTLENPYRVVVDLSDTRLEGAIAGADLGGTPVAGIRSAPRNERDLRVVFDMRHKVKPRSFLQAGENGRGSRLIVDLYPEGVQQAKSSSPAPKPEPSEQDTREIVVALSAGHGGGDPGAIGVGGLREKDVVYRISREVEALINSLPGFRAVMIRDSDRYVGLRERVRIAHREKADLYIAIHADAHESSRAHGSTIYALSQRGATSEQARLLAEKENSADLIGGVGEVADKDEVLTSVLLDLSMTANVATSLEIGDNLIGVLDPITRLRRHNVEQAAFVELKSAGIPSLLIETGYITNPGDAKNLNSAAWRKRFASALVQGISEWFYERPPHGTWVAWQKNHGGLTPAAYIVKRGDTLSQIAERYHVSMAALKNANGLDSNTIQVGQTLKLPAGGAALVSVPVEHTISRGETLSKIALEYSVSLQSLRETNQLKNDVIRVGQVLKIPTT